MREIKFRAWNETHGKMQDILELNWLYNEDTDSRTDLWIITENARCDDKITLMQYTGLKDKNGREIYEGDIIKVEHLDKPYSPKARHKYFNCEVVFYEGHFTYEWPKDYGNFRCGSFLERSEVIGNIYENKELIND